MLRASEMDAVLDPEAIPALYGALPLLGSGITSSLHADNVAALAALDPVAQLHQIAPLLIDPQTAGGLLAGIPADRAATCLAELRRCGYQAALIGRVARLRRSEPRIRFEAGAAQRVPSGANHISLAQSGAKWSDLALDSLLVVGFGSGAA